MFVIFRALLVVLLGFLCTACVTLPAVHLDLDKLYDKKEKYGIVVFRTIYFKNFSSAKYFCAKGVSLNDFFSSDKLNVWTRDYIFNKSSLSGCLRYLSSMSTIKGKDFSSDLFVERRDFFSGVKQTPEYFYAVNMLPEGKYYITHVRHSDDTLTSYRSYDLIYKNGENARFFYVKAGKVNYIGDLYLTSLRFVRSHGIFSNKSTYSGRFLVCDRSKDAYLFFKKFYSDIKLPFVKSIIKCCEPMLSGTECASDSKR